MTQILAQNTQVVVRVGPFVDEVDGVTPQTGVTLSGADEAELLKGTAGAATVDISGRTWAAIASCRGWYNLTLTTTDTNTVGPLIVVVQDDNVCLPVHARFQVVPVAPYGYMWGDNSLNTAIATLSTDVQGMSATIGEQGLNLGQIPWNPVWDAEVQSEVQDALVANNLDHWMGASGTSSDVVNSSWLARILSKEATPAASSYVNTTDSLEAIRDNELTAAAVNAEVVDAVNTDGYTSPAQGAPPTTASLVTMMRWLYKMTMNKKTSSGTLIQHYNDAGTVVDHKQSVSDVGGTVTKERIVTGP